MRRYCGVRGCGNKTLRSGDSSVSFHHLPKQPDIAKVWLLAMDNPKYPCDLVLSAGTSKYRNVLVCSAHFESFDFHYYVTYRRGIYDQMTSEIVDKPILKLDIF